MFRFDPALRGTELRSPVWLWQYLEQIICPTLLLHGEESDLLASDVAHRMIQALPFGSLGDIGRAGHSIPGDNPN